jgi:repressor LexA
MKLTQKQNAVLEFVAQSYREHGYAPTRAEISRHFGFFPNAAECHLRALQARGFVRLQPIKRGIQLVAP